MNRPFTKATAGGSVLGQLFQPLRATAQPRDYLIIYNLLSAFTCDFWFRDMHRQGIVCYAANKI